MEKYKVELASQVYTSLDLIYEYKKQYDQNSAVNFVSGFFDEVEKLSYLPHRGMNRPSNNRALLYKNHLILYHIQEPDTVQVLDIIDPAQYSVASLYD